MRVAFAVMGEIVSGRSWPILASSAVGVFFNSSLALGAKSGLAFWPLITSLAILLVETGRGSGKPLASVVHPGDPDWPGGHAP